MHRLLHSVIFLAVLVCAAPAAAGVYVAGTGEPAFTNTQTNTQFVSWQGSPSYSAYQLEYDYYDNNVFNRTVTQSVAANGSGTNWANWQGIVSPLLEGHKYGVCVYGRYTIDAISMRDAGSCADGSGKRAHTTIDRTKPTIAVDIDAGAAYSRDSSLDYRIDYSDNLAFPFPANFTCREAAPAQSACVGAVSYNAPCSVPDTMTKTTFFECVDDVSALADGPVTFCVQSADAAIPDNPSSSDQTGSASQANISTRVCDSITLDRAAPSLAASASATSVVAGQAVDFAAQASDATSGLSGSYSWAWGDGSADGSGATPSHAFSAPGTYQVTVTTTDAAGNQASANKAITVAAPPAAPSPSPSPAPSPTPTPGAPAQAPAPVTAPVVVSSKLGVAAPKKVRVGRRLKAIAVALTADRPGRASLALVRSGRIHAQGAVTITAAGTKAFRLKVPKKLRAGSYSLKVSWVANGATAATSVARKVAVVAPGKAARAKRARAAVRSSLVDPVGAPVGLPVGG